MGAKEKVSLYNILLGRETLEWINLIHTEESIQGIRSPLVLPTAQPRLAIYRAGSMYMTDLFCRMLYTTQSRDQTKDPSISGL